MRRNGLEEPKAGEAQEAVLSRDPCEVRRDRNACEAAVLNGDLGLCSRTILKASPKPWINVARDVHSRCRNEVMPVEPSVSGVEGY